MLVARRQFVARAKAAGATGLRYSTTFPNDENPLSEGGAWVQGGDVGVQWNNTRALDGVEIGSTINTQYRDCLSHLTGFPANHYAQGTVYLAGGYTTPVYHEVELLLRFAITTNNARGYEVAWGLYASSSYFLLVKWNGAWSDFTYLRNSLSDGHGNPLGAPANGDVLKAQIVGSTIKVYKNDVLVQINPNGDGGADTYAWVDSTWSDGQPGLANCTDPGCTLASYGWSDYEAGSI